MTHERGRCPIPGYRPLLSGQIVRPVSVIDLSRPLFYYMLMMEEKNYEQMELDLDAPIQGAEEPVPASEPDLTEEVPVEGKGSEAEESAPPEFMAEFEAARKYTYRSEEEEEQAEKKKAAAAELKKKQAMRRRVAGGIVAVAALLILVLLVSAVVKKLKPKETVNIGPLPHEDVTVQKVPKYYDYAKPVPSGKDMGEAYFSDALIIGDSRVQSLDLYGAGSFSQILYGSSINVSNALNYTCKSSSGDSISLADALGHKDYGKIYLSLGLSELGWSYSEVFVDNYDALVKKVKELQPQAVIYLVGIFDVTQGKSESGTWLTNSHIAEYNGYIAKIAQDNKVYFINSNEAMTVEGGGLNPDYTGDGVNLLPEGSEAWFTYFRNHTVNPSEYAN